MILGPTFNVIWLLGTPDNTPLPFKFMEAFTSVDVGVTVTELVALLTVAV